METKDANGPGQNAQEIPADAVRNPYVGGFDFRRAWRELADPEYRKLPERMRELHKRVDFECAGLDQLNDLSMPWPKVKPGELEQSPSLREAFEAQTSEDLAVASRVVWSYGHWMPGGSPRPRSRQTGSTWKFAMYCDQILTLRLGVEAAAKGFKVLKGMLQYQHMYGPGGQDGWSNHDLGWGLKMTLHVSEAHLPPELGKTYRYAHGKERDLVGKATERAQANCEHLLPRSLNELAWKYLHVVQLFVEPEWIPRAEEGVRTYAKRPT